jgi:hypothetical protein
MRYDLDAISARCRQRRIAATARPPDDDRPRESLSDVLRNINAVRENPDRKRLDTESMAFERPQLRLVVSND